MASWLPIAQIAEQIRAGKLKTSDLVEQSLKSIEEKAEFKAIIATTAERARQRAEEIDALIADGKDPGRLAGVPFIAKDNFLTLGSETTAASNILKGFKAPYQATAIEKLEAEGAVCVAKANLDAFAHGSSTENSDFFTTLNPHDKTRVPGGSSGGSAAAVVLDMAPFALGTDTGGSIRLPASFCGAVGYKPTYGLVSRSGVVAMSSSCDTIGPLARSVEDVSLVLDVISGQDKLDSTTIDRDKKSYVPSSEVDLKGTKVGIVKEFMGEGLRADVKSKIDEAVAKIKQAGAEIHEINMPSVSLALAAYYIIAPAEISSNLSRYDGQRYGYSSPQAIDLFDSFTSARQAGFGKEAKRRIMMGTFVLSSGYYDAYYKKAQTVRSKIINEFADAFNICDYLLGPTAGITAFKVGQLVDNPLEMYFTDQMTVSANLAGVPGISLPAGVSEQDGMPVGLHLMAPQKADASLLEVAKKTEELLV